MKPYVCMDLDQVVYPFIKAWHRMAAASEMVPVEFADVTQVSYWDFFEGYGIDKAEFEQTIKLWVSDGLFLMEPPSKEVLDNWPKLHRHSYIHVITARPLLAVESTIMWLNYWGLKSHQLDFTSNKSELVPEHHDGPIYAFDDMPKILTEYRQAGAKPYLMKQMHNRHAYEDFPTATFAEFTEIVCRMK